MEEKHIKNLILKNQKMGSGYDLYRTNRIGVISTVLRFLKLAEENQEMQIRIRTASKKESVCQVLLLVNEIVAFIHLENGWEINPVEEEKKITLEELRKVIKKINDSIDSKEGVSVITIAIEGEMIMFEKNH